MVARILAAFAALLLSLGAARAEPVVVTDLKGRELRFDRPPERILLQDGTDAMLLALLDRDEPFARVAAWNRNLLDADPSLWEVLRERWPAADAVPVIPIDGANYDLEAMLALRPDLVVVQRGAAGPFASGELEPIFEAVGAQVVYIDTELSPFEGTRASVELLGRILDREREAGEFAAMQESILSDLRERLPAGKEPRRVFLDIRGGQAGLDHCCKTQGEIAWGSFVTELGALNIGAELLPGVSGEVGLEQVLAAAPDVIVATGSGRGLAPIPFGYGADRAAVAAAASAVLHRAGLDALPAVEAGRAGAIYHQFYKSPFSVVGLQHLARLVHPGRFEALDPDRTYREMVAALTRLPDHSFVFAAGAEGE